MYEANGINLSELEFEELKRLSDYKGSDLVAFAEKRIYDEKPFIFNSDYVLLYLHLHKLGLVAGEQIRGGFRFTGLTYRGRTFVKEYEAEQKQRNKEIWKNRGFQLALSIATVVISALVSVLFTHCSFFC